jgi:hypothetical protein
MAVDQTPAGELIEACRIFPPYGSIEDVMISDLDTV